jgi:putative spermidine/putrescine transport system ATP-binding protein
MTRRADSGGVALRLRDLHRRFGDVRAVDGVDLDVRQGERVALLGPSGSGKTTVLRLVAGFERPDAGAVELHGRDVTGVPPERRDVGVVFQDYALFPHRTVEQNVAFGLRMRRVPAERRRARVEELLDLVGLRPQARRRPDQLSGGQRQRVALARALAPGPQLLLLDEPLANLDRRLREALRGELVAVTDAVGVTCVLVTHDQEEALSFADRVAVMRDGRLAQVGTPAEVWRAPVDAFVATFLGDMNLLPAEGEPTAGRVRVRGVEGLLAVEGGAAPGGGSLVACLRPEALRAVPCDDGPGRVGAVSYVGGSATYAVDVAGQAVQVREVQPDGRPAVAVGDRVRVEPLVAAVRLLVAP